MYQNVGLLKQMMEDYSGNDTMVVRSDKNVFI